MSIPGINLEKLVRQILLDIELLHYFANHGRPRCDHRGDECR